MGLWRTESTKVLGSKIDNPGGTAAKKAACDNAIKVEVVGSEITLRLW